MYLVLVSVNPITITEVSGIPHDGFKVWGRRGDELVFSSKDKPLPAPGSPHSIDTLDSNGNLIRRTRFESELAAVLLKESDLYMNQVLLTSARIVEWLNARVAESAIVRSRQSPKMKVDGDSSSEDDDDDLADDIIAGKVANYLYPRPGGGDRYLGMIGKVAPRTRTERLEAAIQALGSHDVYVHLNFHRMFIEHIIDDATVAQTRTDAGKLDADPHVSTYQVFRNSIQPAAKYAMVVPPPRVPRGGVAQPTKSLGITAGGADDLPKMKKHTRAIDKVARPSTVGPAHSFEQNADKHRMPFVAGPSASAANLFICARTMGQLQNDEMAAYALAAVVFLVGGGMHSFHEVMKSGKISKTSGPSGAPRNERAGLAYVSGDYASVLPDALKRRRSYKDLILRYADLFPAALESMWSW
jgi:hypothetical protein